MQNFFRHFPDCADEPHQLRRFAGPHPGGPPWSGGVEMKMRRVLLLLSAIGLSSSFSVRYGAPIASRSGPLRCTCSVSNPSTRRALLLSAAGLVALPIPPLPHGNGALAEAPRRGLPDDAYVQLNNGLKVCRLQTGLLQLSPKTTLLGPGPEDYWQSEMRDSVRYMKNLVDEGFTTFDLADVYGPAEDYVGAYHDEYGLDDGAVFNTKWIPTGSSRKDKEIVREAVEKSIGRMRNPRLDLVQFYWWDYDKKNYVEMLQNAQELRSEGLLRGVSVTGFDTQRVGEMLDGGVQLASVQASFSVVDTRPIDGGMLKLLQSRSSKGTVLFAHGALMGGFLTDEWLGGSEPVAEKLATSQLRKYYKWIAKWGSWGLLQEMLATLRRVGDRHGGVPIAAVAIAWVLAQPAVASVIVGTKLGGPNAARNLGENRVALCLKLTKDDMGDIAAVQAKGTPLTSFLGDVGGEFHYKSRYKKKTSAAAATEAPAVARQQ